MPHDDRANDARPGPGAADEPTGLRALCDRAERGAASLTSAGIRAVEQARDLRSRASDARRSAHEADLGARAAWNRLTRIIGSAARPDGLPE